MKVDELTGALLADLRPYIRKMSLQDFQDIAFVDEPGGGFSARVVDGRVEFNRRYFAEKFELVSQGDMAAYSDLLNTLHHELCHVDVDCKMPFLTRHLSDNEIFPLGIAFRFTREFLACLGSKETMTADILRAQNIGGVQEINALSKKRDLKSYCKIVCNLAYLVGDCIHAPCDYFTSACNAMEDERIAMLARHFLSIMSELEKKLPLEKEEQLSSLCDAIRIGWQYYSRSVRVGNDF